MLGTTNRREFLKTSAAASAAWWVAGGAGDPAAAAARAARSPNERLNIAAIGAGGKGRTDLANCAPTENIVALCDVDDKRAAESYVKYPKAELFTDFRKMLDRRNDIDAVIVSTPDHTHAVAAIAAMKRGKHVYCQKPLAHSVYEARMMRHVANETKVATQMGNQGHAFDGTRSIVELVRAGVIGKVREVHVWTDRPGKYWKQPVERPRETIAVPDKLNWDLWLGPAAYRPYHPIYVPHDWRAWWDFGTGALGDMGCHVADTAFWALDLGYPTSVEAQASEIHPESPPTWEIIKYEFPARGDLPPVTLTWYDAGKLPPQEKAPGQKIEDNGTLLIGDEGTVFTADSYSSSYKLLPEEKFADFTPPAPTIPRTDNNPYIEWLAACKGGPAALSRFDYSALLTEMILLGNVAVRVGKKIEWDAENMHATNAPEAEQYIRPEFRKGWTL